MLQDNISHITYHLCFCRTDLKKMKATQCADNVQFLPFLTTCLKYVFAIWHLQYSFVTVYVHATSCMIWSSCIESPFSLNDQFVYLCVFSNLGWLYYGLLKGDGTVISVNIIGASLQTLYIITYCHYTKEKVCHLVINYTVGCRIWFNRTF